MYEYKCTKCEVITDELCSYSEREVPTTCEACGSEARIIFSASSFKPSIDGAHGGRLIAPDVGPMSTTSKAYEKKMDDSVSVYAGPGQHGSMTANQREVYKQRKESLDKGQTNFTDTNTEVKV